MISLCGYSEMYEFIFLAFCDHKSAFLLLLAMWLFQFSAVLTHFN